MRRVPLLYWKSYPLIGGEVNDDKVWTYYYSLAVSQLSPLGLDGVTDLINISMNYPACGYIGGDLLLAWDGSELREINQDVDASDAGVYYVSSYPILPGDKGGRLNSILSVTNSVEYEINDAGEQKTLSHDSLVIQYHWAKGKGIVKTDTLFKGKKE